MQKKDRSEWAKSLVLFYRLSGWIVFPVVLAVFVGKWLDDRYDKEPWIFLTSVGFAFIITCVGIVKEALKAIKEAEEENKNK